MLTRIAGLVHVFDFDLFWGGAPPLFLYVGVPLQDLVFIASGFKYGQIPDQPLTWLSQTLPLKDVPGGMSHFLP